MRRDQAQVVGVSCRRFELGGEIDEQAREVVVKTEESPRNRTEMKPVKTRTTKKEARNQTQNDQQQKQKPINPNILYRISCAKSKATPDGGSKSQEVLSRTVTVVRFPIGERRRVEAESAESAFERCSV